MLRTTILVVGGGGLIWLSTHVVQAATPPVGNPAAGATSQPPAAGRPRDTFTPLMNAARANDCPAIAAALDRGANINAQSPLQGMTALMVAARYDAARAADLLVFLKADPNLRSRDGRTALMYAAIRGNAAIVKDLLRTRTPEHKKAEVNLVDHQGANALMWAVVVDQPDVARILIEAGADVNLKAPHGTTPLMVAASKGNVEIVKALLAAGADPAAQDQNSETAASIARATKHMALLPLLSGGPARSPGGTPPPQRAKSDAPSRQGSVVTDRRERSPSGKESATPAAGVWVRKEDGVAHRIVFGAVDQGPMGQYYLQANGKLVKQGVYTVVGKNVVMRSGDDPCLIEGDQLTIEGKDGKKTTFTREKHPFKESGDDWDP